MQGAFLKKAPLQRALFEWFLYKELLRLAGPHFAKGLDKGLTPCLYKNFSLLVQFCNLQP